MTRWMELDEGDIKNLGGLLGSVFCGSPVRSGVGFLVERLGGLLLNPNALTLLRWVLDVHLMSRRNGLGYGEASLEDRWALAHFSRNFQMTKSKKGAIY